MIAAMKKPSGMVFLFASATSFAVCAVFIKLSSSSLGGAMVSGIRFLVGAILCVIVLVASGRGLKPVRPGLVVLRGILGAASMAMSYAAIGFTGPGRATLLSNTYPIIVAVVAFLVFREKPRIRSIVALGLCAIGALLVVRDGSGASLLGDALALGSAVFAGFAINIVRIIAPFESPFMVYLSPCLFGLPTLLMRAGTQGPLDPTGIVFALIVGLLAFIAQILMVSGYKTVPASRGSVVFYFETGLTMVFGILMGERPNIQFFAGLALIACGLVTNQSGREIREEMQPRRHGEREEDGRGKSK